MDLLHAAESGHLSVAKELVTKDKSIIHTCRHTNKENRAFNVNGSAIHYACRSGHLSIVKYLLEQDPTIVDDRDIESWTSLHYACNNGHLKIVQLLLAHNANVKTKDNYLSQTPVQFAMYKQFEEIVRVLNPTIQWTRREVDEISSKGNVPVFRKRSRLFLGRYMLTKNNIEQIELFRDDPQGQDIEVNQIQDVELSHLSVRIQFTHDFQKHITKTNELSSNEGDDLFLRSSTTSTNEHIMVFSSN